ncbi:DUF4153 domain-containing protein [Clostridium kluyveri]|uniref:DUF4153 domain-containing protein n=1 Tax=Clostridium kluyveri TaxID=1534 RepID=UPI002AFF682E|nr:DUF4153 domain-containing protein [Clostridium kluyveri]
MISETTSSDKDLLYRLSLIFALGIPVSLCIKLFLEKKDQEKNPIIFIGSHILGIIFLILYYFLFLRNTELYSITRYSAVSLSLYMAFLFIPYLVKKENFEMYVITVFKSFFITVIYSIILYLGLSAILFTIDKLLEIKVLTKIYYYTWLLVIFLFSMSYFLSGIPSKHKEVPVKSYPKLLKILLLYIIMPLLTAYTIILYIYFVKIIVTSKWPIGMVSHLVIWYSIIVTIVLFFITPIKEENLWQNKFLKFFPKIILPLIVMMFISIGMRINAYGVTENRYFIVILGIWLFFIMVYLSFIKKPKNIMIPVTLSIISLISVFGPTSSYSISKLSQNNRFEKILIKNNMLKNEQIQVSNNISQEDKFQINSILDYFNRNHSLKEVNYLPQGFKLGDTKDIFGFAFSTPRNNFTKEYFNFTRNKAEQAINIENYDYLFHVTNIKDENTPSNSSFTASYDYNTSTIKINHGGNELYTKNLNIFINGLIEKHSIIPEENSLPQEEMTLSEENTNIKVKLIFSNIYGNVDMENKIFNITGIDFYVLVKIK